MESGRAIGAACVSVFVRTVTRPIELSDILRMLVHRVKLSGSSWSVQVLGQRSRSWQENVAVVGTASSDGFFCWHFFSFLACSCLLDVFVMVKW